MVKGITREKIPDDLYLVYASTRLFLQRLDADEEYLTGDIFPVSDFVTAFEVEAVLPIETSATRPSVASAEPEQTRSA